MTASFESFATSHPAVTAGLRALTQAMQAAGLDPALTELVKIRVSQLNGCAFCTSFHLAAARRLGVPAAKLDLLAAWRDAGLYSDSEQAALALAERLTALPGAPLTPAERAAAQAALPGPLFTQLTIAIATIAAWNRIAIGLGFPPPAG